MKGKRILFLACENSVGNALKDLVEDRGNTAVRCEKAVQALEYVRKKITDAVVVDPTDRRSGGAVTIARIKQLDPTLPVIVIADNLTESGREEAFAAGTETIFTTPLSEDAAFATLSQALSPAPPLKKVARR